MNPFPVRPAGVYIAIARAAPKQQCYRDDTTMSKNMSTVSIFQNAPCFLTNKYFIVLIKKIEISDGTEFPDKYISIIYRKTPI